MYCTTEALRLNTHHDRGFKDVFLTIWVMGHSLKSFQKVTTVFEAELQVASACRLMRAGCCLQVPLQGSSPSSNRR